MQAIRLPAALLGAAALALAAPTCAQALRAEEAAARAKAALEAAPVFDGHNDVPNQLRDRFANRLADFDFTDTSRTGATRPDGRAMHTDLARLRQGRVGAQFWSVYVPATSNEAEAVRQVLEQIDVTRRLIDRYPDDLQFATTADEVERAMAQGRIASLLGAEGGHAIGSSLAVLRQLHALGVRYLTLTQNANVPWADAATDRPEHDGLTDFGRAVVREMNRLGMLVDLSHVSEATMMDALDEARAPVIFSHSGARAVTGHARNVPDSVLARLPENGGVVMVVALPRFISEAVRQWGARRAAEDARLKALWLGQPDKVAEGLAAWDKANPEPRATISDMADHIDHIRKIAGVEYIGIGGDFDGMPSGPEGFEDVRGYPALFAELARRGYSQAELEMIASRNILRVMRAAEAYAASRADAAPGEAAINAPAPE